MQQDSPSSLVDLPQKSPSANPLKGASGVKKTSLIQIPPEARNWSVESLPLSTRLRHVMESRGCKVLGDLHDLSFSELSETPNCGGRTLVHLQQLITRIEKGEFGPPRGQENQSPIQFLISTVDAFFSTLESRKLSIFMDRLGAQAAPMTLHEVGTKYSMTRERVRQITEGLTRQAFLFGGPPFIQSLQQFAADINQKVLPLTPGLLTELLKSGKQPAYSVAFYTRLLGWLSPELSSWPAGQLPAAYRSKAHEEILDRAKEWFGKRAEPAKTSEVYQGISAGGFSCKPFDFLEALKFAAEFNVTFENPTQPLIHPPLASARRWALKIMSETGKPKDLVERAKAILYSKRAPGSRYRLLKAK